MTKWYSRLVRRPVVIVTKQDESFRGFIQNADAHGVVHADVQALPADGEPVEIQGVLLFLRENVAYFQLPDGVA